MKIKFLLCFFLLPLFAVAQKTRVTIPTQKNIFRILISQALTPDFEPWTVNLNFEKSIGKKLTISTKAGPGVSIKNFGDYPKVKQFSYHAYADAEVRYFFSLTRRFKKGKPLENYSAPYISLEQNIITNPIFTSNIDRRQALEGSSRTFFNLGYQKQVSKLYFQAVIGVAFTVIDFEKYNPGQNITPLHGGLSLGYVF